MIRLNGRISENFGIKKTDKWFFALDEEELPLKKHFYLIKANSNFTMGGKKMILINKSFSLDARNIIKELNIKIPIKCKIENFKDKYFQGIQVKFV